MPKSLKDARNEGDLESFIKEHEKDEPGDLDKLEKAIRHSDRVPEREGDPADMKALNFTLAFAAGMYWGFDLLLWFISLLGWLLLTLLLARIAAPLIHPY